MEPKHCSYQHLVGDLVFSCMNCNLEFGFKDYFTAFFVGWTVELHRTATYDFGFCCDRHFSASAQRLRFNIKELSWAKSIQKPFDGFKTILPGVEWAYNDPQIPIGITHGGTWKLIRGSTSRFSGNVLGPRLKTASLAYKMQTGGCGATPVAGVAAPVVSQMCQALPVDPRLWRRRNLDLLNYLAQAGCRRVSP